MVVKTNWVDGNILGSSDMNDLAEAVNAANAHVDALLNAAATLPRLAANGSVQPSSGEILLSYFTADENLAIHNLTAVTAGTAAAAHPTLCKMAIYAVDGANNLTLGMATSNDITFFAAANTVYTGGLTGSYSLTQGSRYAVAVLVTSTVAVPNFVGAAVNAAEAAVAPRLSGAVGSQTDMPGTITAGSISSFAGVVYARAS